MDTLVTYLLGLIPTLLTGALLAILQRNMRRRDREAEQTACARKQESLLQMKMLMAGNKLSFAVAMAIKRGKANGEVEEAVEAYHEAKTEYDAFLNEQAAEHLTGGNSYGRN